MMLSVVSSFTSMNDRAVKQTKTKMSRTKAKLASSNSCVTTAFSSSSVRNSLSLQLGLIWNCANGLRGIVIVCSQHDTLQPHAALPDSSACQSSVRTKIGRKVLDKLWRQFQHRHICPAVMRLDKLSHILP